MKAYLSPDRKSVKLENGVEIKINRGEGNADFISRVKEKVLNDYLSKVEFIKPAEASEAETVEAPTPSRRKRSAEPTPEIVDVDDPEAVKKFKRDEAARIKKDKTKDLVQSAADREIATVPERATRTRMTYEERLNRIKEEAQKKADLAAEAAKKKQAALIATMEAQEKRKIQLRADKQARDAAKLIEKKQRAEELQAQREKEKEQRKAAFERKAKQSAREYVSIQKAAGAALIAAAKAEAEGLKDAAQTVADTFEAGAITPVEMILKTASLHKGRVVSFVPANTSEAVSGVVQGAAIDSRRDYVFYRVYSKEKHTKYRVSVLSEDLKFQD